MRHRRSVAVYCSAVANLNTIALFESRIWNEFEASLLLFLLRVNFTLLAASTVALHCCCTHREAHLLPEY